MLPNFKRSDTEPPKVSPPGFTPTASAPPTPGARSIGLARPAERNAPSVIGPDLTINGNLISRGEVQIDGEVHGDIQGTYVVIGEKARITGGIVAEEIVVRGHVMGSVRGKRVMLQSSSHVEGDIFHQALAIEQGAFFEGKSRRSDDPTAEAPKPEIPSSLSGGLSG
ncbi:MAG: polymer-forming cytoskeletal protein [Hyphomicrobium sp.]|jgi:cytoskeletal protein CcmA (bactofilin family)